MHVIFRRIRYRTGVQMVENVMPAAHEDPAKGWELLRAPALTSHPDRTRFLCHVCWIALDRGMAEQVRCGS